jgi:hypothetical protein
MEKIKLLFTCPHNGAKKGTTTNPPIIERVSERFSTNICPPLDGQGFSIKDDVRARKITEKIVENIQSLSGKDPYTVYAEFKRDWIDYNRKERCAVDPDSPNGIDEYNKYHDAIKEKIEEMLPGGDTSLAFLFDIHGTDDDKSPPDIDREVNFIELLIGTDQTRSRQALTREDPHYFWDPTNGLIPLLNKRGIIAFPEDEIQEQQSFPLDGGHTIKTYGGPERRKPGLVAIQIEVIRCIRDHEYFLEKFAADMAGCILKFVHPFV